MSNRRNAFTLFELLVVVAVLGVVLALFLPVVARAKELGYRSVCASQLRQLNLALRSFADDHEGRYPTRDPDQPWPVQLLSYYTDPSLLKCPSDAQRALPVETKNPGRSPRSYSLNGFGDPDAHSPETERWAAFIAGPDRGTVHESAVMHPSETVLIGETRGDGLYVDLKRESGSFIEVLELGRHGEDPVGEVPARTGAANHAFADGSVRHVEFGKAICPVNLWGVTDYYRTNYALCFF